MAHVGHGPAFDVGPAPKSDVGRPPWLAHWTSWLSAVVVIILGAALAWFVLAGTAADTTPALLEDFSGVNDHVAARIAADVEPTPFIEDFTGLDAAARAFMVSGVVETEMAEDFTGVDQQVASRTAAAVVPTPFQENFAGLD